VVASFEQTFREQWGRVLAAMIGFLGDFDLAEEAAQQAFAIAAERWRALVLVHDESERTFIERRLDQVESPSEL
jgi:predicted RNA polymerase sigma factor